MKKHYFFRFLFAFLVLGLPHCHAQSMLEKFAKKQIDKGKNKSKIGETHQKYMAKIVFSGQKIDIDQPDESAFVVSSSLDKPLFFRAYWEQPLENTFKDTFKDNAMLNSAELYKVYFNDELAAEHIELSLNKTEAANTWYSTWGAILYSPQNSEKNIYNQCLIKALQKKINVLKEGKVVVRVENYAYNISANTAGKLMATGELTLECSKAAIELFKKQFPSSALAYPECLPTPKQQDRALETELLATVKEKGWPEEHRHLVIMDRDYVLAYDEVTKLIADRSLKVAVGARRNGKCWYQTFVLFQPYMGGGTYSKTFRVSTNRIGDQVPVPCSCLFEN